MFSGAARADGAAASPAAHVAAAPRVDLSAITAGPAAPTPGPLVQTSEVRAGAVDRRVLGVGVTILGGAATLFGAGGTYLAFSLHESCRAAPCPSAVSDAGRAAIVGGTLAGVAILTTGIVLVATAPSHVSMEKALARLPLKPTAEGLAFSF